MFSGSGENSFLGEDVLVRMISQVFSGGFSQVRVISQVRIGGGGRRGGKDFLHPLLFGFGFTLLASVSVVGTGELT